MSTDKSLKSKSTLERHRNVLTRPERIAHLKDVGVWQDDRQPFGLPKVAHRKAAVGKKEKTKKAEGEAGAAPAAGAGAAAAPAAEEKGKGKK